MAFWGVEVRTGRPFTHSSQNAKGRLRISQATLANGTAMEKSFVQCNVGNKSPVLLCVLVPEKVESCHLELEFEEMEDVVFSVIGPRRVYLTGYYVASSQHRNMQSDSESYGEDIAESDELDHCTDDDEYEDSFIDDDEARSSGPSPVSSQSTEIETPMESIPKDRKLNVKRPKNRRQVIDSDDDISEEVSEDEDNIFLSRLKSKNSDKNLDGKECDKPKANFDGEVNENIIKDSDDEDLFAFTMFKRKNSPARKAGDGEQNDNPTVNSGGEVKTANNQSCEDQPDIVDAKNETISGIGAVNCEKPKKKRKERSEDVKNLDTDIGMITEAKEEHPEDKFGNVNQDLHTNIKKPNPVNEMEVDSHSADTGGEKGPKLKKRKKSKKGGNNPTVEGEEFPGNTEAPTKIDEIQTPNNLNVSEGKPDQPANGSISENKIKKTKKKKKSATEDTDAAGSVAKEPENVKVELIPNLVNKNADLATEWTLSNGVEVIELSKGKLDGKVAATGKKVKIQYTAMLKENGHVIDSNVGKSSYKFRLGNQDVIEGLHCGINGMRVGEKRKLIIPPSMGYGSQGTGENIPPNSWLVYEVELLGVGR